MNQPIILMYKYLTYQLFIGIGMLLNSANDISLNFHLKSLNLTKHHVLN